MLSGNTFFFEWEVSFMTWLQSICGTFGKTAAVILSVLGEEIVLVGIIGILYWGFNKKYGRFIGVNIVTAVAFNSLIKNIFLRRRPYMDNEQIKCLRPAKTGADVNNIEAQGYSFPSGHAMNSTTVYGSLALYAKKAALTVTAIVLPLLVSLSRVMLGVHYPTDVLAGIAFGVAVTLLLSFLQRKIKHRWLLYLCIAAIASTGLFYCKSSDYFSAYGLMLGFFCGDLFEQRFVGFSDTRIWWQRIVRFIGGIATFLIMNWLLKLPLSKQFADSPGLLSHLYRTLRYLLAVFTAIGVYPLSFKMFCSNKQSAKGE